MIILFVFQASAPSPGPTAADSGESGEAAVADLGALVLEDFLHKQEQEVEDRLAAEHDRGEVEQEADAQHNINIKEHAWINF